MNPNVRQAYFRAGGTKEGGAFDPPSMTGLGVDGPSMTAPSMTGLGGGGSTNFFPQGLEEKATLHRLQKFFGTLDAIYGAESSAALREESPSSTAAPRGGGAAVEEGDSSRSAVDGLTKKDTRYPSFLRLSLQDASASSLSQLVVAHARLGLVFPVVQKIAVELLTNPARGLVSGRNPDRNADRTRGVEGLLLPEKKLGEKELAPIIWGVAKLGHQAAAKHLILRTAGLLNEGSLFGVRGSSHTLPRLAGVLCWSWAVAGGGLVGGEADVFLEGVLGRKRADKNFSEWFQSSYRAVTNQF